MNPVIEELFETRTTHSPQGEQIKLNSEVSRKGGRFLHDIVAGHDFIAKTLEVGCAYGVSSLHICEGLKGRAGAHHTMIDPFQKTDWKSAGIHALERAGFNNYTLIEEKSEFALPALAKEQEGAFDFVFVDGWHTLDHVMVDCFYASRLLKPGGFLAMDDTNMAGIAKVVKYLANYPCYRRYGSVTYYPENAALAAACHMFSAIPMSYNFHTKLPHTIQKLKRFPNIVALQKTTDDQRPWNWYKPF